MKSNTILPKDKNPENQTSSAQPSKSVANTSSSAQAPSDNAKPKTLFKNKTVTTAKKTDTNAQPNNEITGCPACGMFSFPAPGKK